MDSVNLATNRELWGALNMEGLSLHPLTVEKLRMLEENLTPSDKLILAENNFDSLECLFAAKGNNSAEFIGALVSFKMYVFLSKNYPQIEEVIRQIPEAKFQAICTMLPQEAQNLLSLQPQPINFFHAALKTASNLPIAQEHSRSLEKLTGCDLRTIEAELSLLVNIQKLLCLRPSKNNNGPTGIKKKSKVHKHPAGHRISSNASAHRKITAMNLQSENDFETIKGLVVPMDEELVKQLGFRDFTHLYKIANNTLDCLFKLLLEFKCYALLADSCSSSAIKIRQFFTEDLIEKIVATLPESTQKHVWLQNPLPYLQEIFNAAAIHTYGPAYLENRSTQVLNKKVEQERLQAFTTKLSQLNL